MNEKYFNVVYRKFKLKYWRLYPFQSIRYWSERGNLGLSL